MANLKRNTIELITGYDEKNDKLETKRYWTAPFTPLRKMYDATDLMDRLNSEDLQDKEAIEIQLDFVANVVYDGQFTSDELVDGIDITTGIDTLQTQILFIAQGEQSDETKKFLEKKN